MPESRPVYRCLCYPHTFIDLKQLIEAESLTTVPQITERTGCGSGCGLCLPYLELLLRTGETAFAVLSSKEAEEQK